MNRNKISVLISVMMTGVTITACGQEVSLNLFGGYTFQDQISFSTGYGVINDGAHWGGSIELFVKRYLAVELLYQRQDTETNFVGGSIAGEAATGINYIMVGGVKYMLLGGPVQPYAGFSVGMAVFNAKDIGENVNRFAMGLKAGILYEVSPKIGIRVQAQVLNPVQGAGSGVYFGSGSGAGVSSYSSIYQFGFTGGVQIKPREY